MLYRDGYNMLKSILGHFNGKYRKRIIAFMLKTTRPDRKSPMCLRDRKYNNDCKMSHLEKKKSHKMAHG